MKKTGCRLYWSSPRIWPLALGALGSMLAGIAAGREPPTSVALDLAALDADTYTRLEAPVLEKRILIRLVEEGFAVVRQEEQPEIILDLQLGAEGLVIGARGAGRRWESVLSPTGEPVGETHLEIAQKAVELARLARQEIAGLNLTAAVPAAAPPAKDEPVLTQPVTRPEEPRWQARLGLELLWRADAIDPLIRVGLRVPLAGRLGLSADFGWSTSSAPDLRVNEYQVAAGVGYQVPLAADLWLEVEALAGLLVHRFSMEKQPAAEPRGTGLDLLLSLPARLAYRFHPHGTVVLSLSPGVAGRSRKHVEWGTNLWSRGRLRLEAGLGVAVVW